MTPRPGRKAASLRLQDTVRLGADGVAKVLGDLEARVMEAVWRAGTRLPARAAHDLVLREHEVALLTVVTVLNKLVDKGILRRRKREDVFHYEATLSREDFMARASRRMVEGILAFETEAVAASLVDVLAERDPEQLQELARLVRLKLREQGGK